MVDGIVLSPSQNAWNPIQHSPRSTIPDPTPRAHPCEIARVVSDEACNPTFPEIAEVRGKKAMSKV